ncbi:MAG TPA: DUF748 domain-containing protein [Candidatus Binatia bacterium]|nr:DUF748 domain-containing protein [Candidatus Binatia bacterium]
MRRSPWLWLLVALIGLRIVAPVLLAPLVEKELSRVVGARVDVRDISFAPIDAVVTLHGVTVHAPDAREADAPAAVPAIAAGDVRIDVQWLPLLHRSLVVRELALESASIDLGRFGDAGGSFERVLHVDPAAELPQGWTFALGRIALRDARLRLRDFGGAEAAPFEVGVREARVATRQNRASAFRRAPNLRVDALVDGGRIRIDGNSDLRDDGVAIDALLRVKDVPLDRIYAARPDLGSTAVHGRLSGELHYQRDPGRRDLLTGRVRLRRAAVRVPGMEEAALAVRRVDVDVDAIDVRRRRVALGSLRLHGARLSLPAGLATDVPLVAGGSPGGAGERPARNRPFAARARAGDAPWTWELRELALPNARIDVTAPEGRIELAAGASAENIGAGAYWSPLRAWVSRGAGAASFDGTVRVARGLTIAGRLTARDVDAASFASAFAMPHADLVQAGRGRADLDVELAAGTPDGPSVDVTGKVDIDDLWLAGPDPGSFAIGARAVGLTLAAIAPARSERGRARPAEVRFGDATVAAPYVLVTHTRDGWLLPPFAPDDAGVDSEPADAVPGPEFVFGHVHWRDGRVVIVDGTAVPESAVDLGAANGWADGVRLPARELSSFLVEATSRDLGALQLAGSAGPGRADVDVFARSLPLASAAPYLTRAGLPYWFVGGTGSVVSHVALAGARWSADTALTVRDPAFGGDRAALRQSFGMPVEDAMAALRDPDGVVTLRLPLSSSAGERRGALDGIVATALREAVARARETPLSERAIRIAFPPGRIDFNRAAAQQLSAIARILESRRDVTVELTGTVARDDRRWLAEQAAAADLDESDGFFGALFGARGRNDRIRDALAARAAGRPGRLDADDEAALRELVASAPPIPDDRLAVIAAARSRAVADLLVHRWDVSPDRVIVAEPGRDEAWGPPTVQARFAVDDPDVRFAAHVEPDDEPW